MKLCKTTGSLHMPEVPQEAVPRWPWCSALHDDVAQPSVTCVVNITTPENMDRTLLCSADLQPLTKFIWRSPGGEKTAEFTLKDCYAEEGSSSVLAVILSILILLVLVAVLVLLWRWRKCKKPAEAALRKSEEEAGLMEDTVQGNKDCEDDHSENTGNRTSTLKGSPYMVFITLGIRNFEYI
ncbi:hypothetical protein J4Q44_G00196370 [Coregonus suidteri]|uniref:Uncharacterized protein n=1 Tax=Coregonus suidteri TaxID=861788 RepID=A0AAN8QSN3_9TELE